VEAVELFDDLKRDHAGIQALFEKVAKTSEDSPSTRARCFQELTSVLLSHIDLEERVFYSILENIFEAQDLVLEAYGEHTVMKEQLKNLATLGYESPDWPAHFSDLQCTFERHGEEEEGPLFHKLKVIFDPLALKELGRQYRLQKERERQNSQEAEPLVLATS
jgi:Hemerythrin HHE cation binding domain